MSVTFTVNSKSVTLLSPPNSPLLWALRDELNLVGVKFGCGAGLCGACTILVDGQAVRSCQTSVGEAAGKAIVTIEGLSGPVFDAVIAGWIQAQAPQCGYCQPGFVVAATQAISANPSQDVNAVLGQITNLCRCGTYDAIRAALKLAIERLQPDSAQTEKTP